MEKTKLEERLKELLNSENREQDSDTPDFILAEYMMACLDAFELANNKREVWYGVELVPGQAKGRRLDTLDVSGSVFFCSTCQCMRPVESRASKDTETGKPYTDICCKECDFIVATTEILLNAQEKE